MATTTIRVDVATRAKLLELGAASGSSLTETVAQAAEALRRQRFARIVGGEFAALRRDPSAWRDYLAEAEATSVADGLGR